MADGTNNMPDQSQALLALKQYTDQQSAGKPAPLLCLIPGGGRDLALQNLANPIKDKNIVNWQEIKSGPIGSLLKQMGLKGPQLFDDIKNCGKNIAAIYDGPLPSGSSVSAPAGSGSFVDSIGPRGSGGFTPDM